MLCVPKVDVTIPANRHIKLRSFQAIKTAIQLQRSWVLKEVEKKNGKKKLHQPPLCIEPASRQNKLESGLLSALATCANKAVVGDSCIILTPWFRETKGLFCFSFNKSSPKDGLRKMCFFAYVIPQKGSKLQGKNMQNIV